MDEILECRSLYEEANDAIRMRSSDHYRDYMRMKPLTPLLQNLLDEIYAQYTMAEARVRYIYTHMIALACINMPEVMFLLCLCVQGVECTDRC